MLSASLGVLTFAGAQEVPSCDRTNLLRDLTFKIENARVTLDRKGIVYPAINHQDFRKKSELFREVSMFTLKSYIVNKQNGKSDSYNNFIGDYYGKILGPVRTEQEIISDGMLVFPMTDMNKKLYPFAFGVYFDPKNNFDIFLGLNFKF